MRCRWNAEWLKEPHFAAPTSGRLHKNLFWRAHRGRAFFRLQDDKEKSCAHFRGAQRKVKGDFERIQAQERASGSC